MADCVGEVEAKIIVNLTVNGVPVPLELDRENAERLIAKVSEALGRPQPSTYVPCPYPVYPPPVWQRPWITWGPVWGSTSTHIATHGVQAITSSTVQLKGDEMMTYTATVD